MKTLWLMIWSRSKYLLTLAVLASVASGIARAGLLALVNAGFAGARVDVRHYLVLCLAAPLFSLAAELLNSRTVNECMQHVVLSAVRRILRVPLARAEALGSARLLTVLTQDVLMVTGGLQLIPALALNISIVIGCVIYLAWLSPTVLGVALALVAGGAGALRLAHMLAGRHLVMARQSAEQIFRLLETMTRALKELKLNGRRRVHFLDRDLLTAATAYKRHTLIGAAAYSVSGNWSQLLFFAVMGSLIFVPVWSNGDGRLISGYGLTLLFLLGPLAALVGSGSNVATALAAARRLVGVMSALGPLESDTPGGALPRAPHEWDAITLSGVRYVYQDADGADGFTVGPIDLRITRGEIVFLIGGNGSGKTTLLKVLCGLYRPHGGQVQLGERTVGDAEIHSYRELIGAVFADYHLFDQIVDADDGHRDEDIRACLARLQLADKVTVARGVFSTTALSQGQRKRLALATASLEDRPVLVFDEWAAEQDPTFKRIFYRVILPALQQEGRTIIVVTHDEAHLDVADQVVKLEDGQVASRARKAVSSLALA